MQNLSTWYHTQIEAHKLEFDIAQEKLLNDLDQFLYKFAKSNFITRLWGKDNKLGYYIYGDVGSGKSMIMNQMYSFTQNPRKLRVHFHEFMQQTHQKLGQMVNHEDPLSIITKDLKKQYDIIYLDEMHVSDIATAMIMKKVLENLFLNKIYIVTSSNYHPDQLWPDGLMRERFLPAIEIIKDNLIIAKLASATDYRLINESINKLFVIQNTEARKQLEDIFNKINLDHQVWQNKSIEIYNREISCIKYGKDVIWFDFLIICGAMRSQLDYLELVKKFQWFIISDIFALTQDKKDIARRFTWLIDVLYDNNCKLSLSSTVAIEDIYPSGDFALEFERTVSRLEEMQTYEYLQKKLTAKGR